MATAADAGNPKSPGRTRRPASERVPAQTQPEPSTITPLPTLGAQLTAWTSPRKYRTAATKKEATAAHHHPAKGARLLR